MVEPSAGLVGVHDTDLDHLASLFISEFSSKVGTVGSLLSTHSAWARLLPAIRDRHPRQTEHEPPTRASVLKTVLKT
jgi:hypothetical protein